MEVLSVKYIGQAPMIIFIPTINAIKLYILLMVMKAGLQNIMNIEFVQLDL